MSYTELDYLQEEVLGYFTEDKSDIEYDIARKREIETKSGNHDYKKRGSSDMSERNARTKVFKEKNDSKNKKETDNFLNTQTIIRKQKDIDRRKNRSMRKDLYPEHGPGNKNDRKRARKAAQNQESTNESFNYFNF